MNSTNQATKLKTLPGPWSLGEMTGNWRDIDLPDHGGVMRIVWKMEDDEGRNDALEAQAHAVVAALNAAFSKPPAEQQATATSSAVLKAIRAANMQLVRTGDDAFMLVPYKVATAEAETAPRQEPTEIPEEIERMAADRYKVVPSESTFHCWAVVAGTGTQRLYLGREVVCQNMARKFAGAFLDGAFVAMQRTAPQPAPAPVSDDTKRLNWLLWKLPGDALRYVVGELSDTSSGAEFRAAIDAALAAQGGKA